MSPTVRRGCAPKQWHSFHERHGSAEHAQTQSIALVRRSFAHELHVDCVLSTQAWRCRHFHCVFTALLLRMVCTAIPRRFFLTCSKFDGAHSARGVCLAHLGDSPAHVWRSHRVCEDPGAHVRIYRVFAIFFVRRASAVASPVSGTGALRDTSAICEFHQFFWRWTSAVVRRYSPYRCFTRFQVLSSSKLGFA